jgi:hypothetical protein
VNDNDLTVNEKDLTGRTRSEESGIKLEVVQLNVYNLSQVIRFIGQSSAAFDAVYARFFLHAVSQIGERNFWRLSANVLKPGGKCCIEFRTDRDVRAQVGARISENERSDGHYRRFINVEQVMAEAGLFGFATRFATSGTGMAAFHGEDPHVGRLLLEKL